MTGRHRMPPQHRLGKVVITAAATTGTLAAITPGTAGAATPADWNKVAACESGGDWAINTGNGFYGGLQFTRSTWDEFGGTQYAPRADLATPAQQKAIADKTLAVQGWNAWPTCSKKAGVTGESTRPAPSAPAPATTAPAPATPAPSTHGGSYTVRSGDTLGRIAASLGVNWHQLYDANTGVIGSNPNLIFPGQVLTVSGGGTAPPAVAVTPAPAQVQTTAQSVGRHTLPSAHIINSFGPVRPQTQAAADQVVADVPGAGSITLGGTRASAIDPHGHPSGLAIDYMVLNNVALGNAVVQYHIAHWNELGVEYLIYQQRILTSPNGVWKQMENRGSPTANHLDHVHVNYRG